MNIRHKYIDESQYTDLSQAAGINGSLPLSALTTLIQALSASAAVLACMPPEPRRAQEASFRKSQLMTAVHF